MIKNNKFKSMILNPFKKIFNAKPGKGKAFTLAETLITLTLIGIVAAFSVPVVEKNYRQMIVVTKLKHTYYILSEVFEAAMDEYGPMTEWDLKGMYGTRASNNNTSLGGELSDSFVTKYILPFVNYTDYSRKSFSDHGYVNGIKNSVGGGLAKEPSSLTSGLTLANGEFIYFSWYYSQKSDDKNKTIHCVAFTVDIDGPTRGPNQVGRDVFAFILPFETPKLYAGMYQFTYNAETDTYTPVSSNTRSQNIELCKSDKPAARLGCTGLIVNDNWKISRDYPVHI